MKLINLQEARYAGTTKVYHYEIEGDTRHKKIATVDCEYTIEDVDEWMRDGDESNWKFCDLETIYDFTGMRGKLWPENRETLMKTGKFSEWYEAGVYGVSVVSQKEAMLAAQQANDSAHPDDLRGTDWETFIEDVHNHIQEELDA